MNLTVSETAGQQRKSKAVQVVVFLLVLSFGLLTTLVILQDRTIDAQRDLIHLLFKDSQRLQKIEAAIHASVRRRAHPASAVSTAPAPVRSAKPEISAGNIEAPKVVTPSAQVQLNQKASQLPLSQEKRQSTAKPSHKQHKTGKANPFRPPAEITDPSDMRRTLFSI